MRAAESAEALFRTKQKPAALVAPTTAQFESYQLMFDHFNRELFGGSLPHVMLNFSRDHKRAVGYYAPRTWQQAKHRLDEITLNPDHLKRGAKETASTLVHEMVHLWQFNQGTPSRTGYHNREWAAKMEQVGLIPSNTGKPGGKRVGQQMTHYIQKDGAFEKSFEKLARTLPWESESRCRGSSGQRKYDKSKVKYTCPSCGSHVWGKPMLRIECVDCEVRFGEAAE